MKVRPSVYTLFLLPLSVAGACGGPERPPNAPASETVLDMRRGAGPGLQDCGEGVEPRGETACRIHPVGECLLTALKECRSAFGVRQYFTAEGDTVRVDWLVLSDGHGGCELVQVEDRSADPLARKKPRVEKCRTIVWRAHESIEGCEMPAADGCR